MCCCCTRNDTGLSQAVGVAMHNQAKQNQEGKRWVRNPAFDYKPGIVRDAREQVWDIIRKNPDITSETIQAKVKCSKDQIHYWLKGWRLAGYVSCYPSGSTNRAKVKPTYKVIKDVGQEPPRVDRNGHPMSVNLNESLWRTMRVQKTFNARQLHGIVSDMQLSAIKTYLHHLLRAKYLKVIKDNRGELNQYQLMEDTGCKPPKILRGKKVFDQNLGIIVYDPTSTKGATHDC